MPSNKPIKVTLESLLSNKFRETLLHKETTDAGKDKDAPNLNSTLSKSLNNLLDNPEPQSTDASGNKHRFERISYSKRLQTRQGGLEVQEKERTIVIRDRGAAQAAIQIYNNDNGKRDKRRDIGKYQTRRKSRPEGKSELNSLEQSGIYQIDLSSIRNEIPPVPNLPPLSANTERSYPMRQRREKTFHQQTNTSAHKAKRKNQKWRDDCDCLRCQIIKRQYKEGDEAYKLWGNYPCKNNVKMPSRSSYYDSD